MHNSKTMKKFFGVMFVMASILLGVPALASADSSPVPIHLTIATFDQTLFDGEISVEACPDTQFGTSTTVNAFCAVNQAASSSGLTLATTWYSFGESLDGVGSYTADYANGRYWLYYIDRKYAEVGLGAHILTPGEEILLTHGTAPLRVVAASTTPTVGTATLLTAQYFNADYTVSDWVAATNTTFMINGTPVASDASGTLLYTPVSTSPVTITARSAGYVLSKTITLLPVAAPAAPVGTTIHLDVEAYDKTLYSGDITVYPCLDTQFGTTTTVNAFCAVNQAASSSGWALATTWYSFGESLDGINSYTSDFVNNNYWLYYIDRVSAPIGLGSHILTPGEEILLTYGTAPLRVVASSTSLSVGSQVTFLSQSFDSASAFDWVSATGTTFIVDGVATSSDADGTLTLTLTSPTPIVVSITKPGSIGSKSITITPTGATLPSSPSGGTSGPETTHTIDISKAVQFLRSLQNTDGSFGAALYTDWVAIGLGNIAGADDMRGKLKTYFTIHTDPGSLLTDLERRAMALEALGVDPAVGTTRNYIADINARFDGTQFGDANEVNDDMFALIALTHAGYDATDDEIASDVNFIISKQSVDGSWGNIDLTAAGIEALSPLSTLPGVSASINKAKAALHTAQQADGGFGSSFATSWVLNAINGMPSEVLSRDWVKGGRTPADYLWLLQQTDGAVGENSLDTNSRVWATAYALTGGSGTDWDGALDTFTRASGGATHAPHTGIGGEVLGAAIATGGSTASASSTVVSTSTTPAIKIAKTVKISTSSEMFIWSDASASSSATSSITKATSTTPKVKSVKTKKKVGSIDPMKQTASVSSAVPSVPPAPAETPKASKGIGSFIVDPFSRFFKFVGSWF